MNSVQSFYDGLALDYDAVYADWEDSVRRQGIALAGIIGSVFPGPQRILDCTCGIGTQSIGLALLGHEVTGTDLSPRAIGRAREEATKFGVEVRFAIADMRDLDERELGSFDVVISCDNALPHFLEPNELSEGVAGMTRMARTGGLVLASIRDYDEILAARPGATRVNVRERNGERTIAFQIWTWESDGPVYQLEQFVGREVAEAWDWRRFTTRYRATTRAELGSCLAAGGLTDIRWLMPEETGFFQPVVAAAKVESRE